MKSDIFEQVYTHDLAQDHNKEKMSPFELHRSYAKSIQR